jgi:DcuC family C4-dicarboxylate transporter
MNLEPWIAVVDLLVVLYFVARRVDVRLVLILGALPLFLAVGRWTEMFVKMAAEMSNPGTVVPIGAAMGFAHVLKLTGCDQHLVRLLLIPVRRFRPLLVPGGIASAYLVNSAIVSQAGTAAVIGPILIPVLQAGGISSARAGALLLLGSSMGGELFNPGAVEMRKLAELTGLPGSAVVARSAWLNLTACATALTVFWLLTPRRSVTSPPAGEDGAPAPGVNLARAVVPLIPLVLLLVANTVADARIPRELAGPPTILVAMLIGVAAAVLATPNAAGDVASAFFEGAGYAYTHVISLIVAASVFAEGVKLSGLIEVLMKAAASSPGFVTLLSVFLPWSLAVASGTGIAPAVSVMEFFVPATEAMGLDPVRLGTLSAMGAHFGRTMSPAAAVVAISARLSGTGPRELVRLVSVPLLGGGIVLVLAALLSAGR